MNINTCEGIEKILCDAAASLAECYDLIRFSSTVETLTTNTCEFEKSTLLFNEKSNCFAESRFVCTDPIFLLQLHIHFFNICFKPQTVSNSNSKFTKLIPPCEKGWVGPNVTQRYTSSSLDGENIGQPLQEEDHFVRLKR